MQENYQNMVMSKKKRGPYSASTMAEKSQREWRFWYRNGEPVFFLKKIGSRIQYNILPKHLLCILLYCYHKNTSQFGLFWSAHCGTEVTSEPRILKFFAFSTSRRRHASDRILRDTRSLQTNDDWIFTDAYCIYDNFSFKSRGYELIQEHRVPICFSGPLSI